MIKYKLTNQNLQTHKGFQWVVGIKQTTNGKGELCGPGFLHYYHDPLLAVLLNPIHADIKNPKLFEVEADGKHLNDLGLKGGCTEMTLLREIELPKITTEQRIAFAILCVKRIYDNKHWIEWSDKWLSGEDRRKKSALLISSSMNACFTTGEFAATVVTKAAIAYGRSFFSSKYIGNLTAAAAVSSTRIASSNIVYEMMYKDNPYSLNLIEIANLAISKY